MGLDMYLSASRYMSEYMDADAHKSIVPLADQLLPPDGNHGSITIKRDVAYWRKANQIHGWFVTNVQDGKDDCGTYDVDLEKLIELRNICQKIVDKCPLKKGKVTNGYSFENGVRKPIIEDGELMTNTDLALELLPPSEGFFFGSDELNNWYMDDIKSTVKQIDKVTAWVDAEQALTGKAYSPIDIQYHSSW